MQESQNAFGVLMNGGRLGLLNEFIQGFMFFLKGFIKIKRIF